MYVDKPRGKQLSRRDSDMLMVNENYTRGSRLGEDDTNPWIMVFDFLAFANSVCAADDTLRAVTG